MAPDDAKKENSPPAPFVLSVAKKAILQDLGATEQTITGIRSNEEAEEYRKYLESKKVTPDDKKSDVVFKPNAGVNPNPADKFDLGEPKAVDNGRWNAEAHTRARFNLAHPSRAKRWNDNARVLMVYGDDGEPRCF